MDHAPGSPTAADHGFLERAYELAELGWGRAHPNPMVGCVLVKEGRIVGEGWHEEFGAPHAEVRALEVAGGEAEGSTAYVSLEPCDHTGKTGPCTRVLLRAGVSRVVYGAEDPGSGAGGARTLAAAGIEVVGPAYSPAEARRRNPAYFHQVPSRPWTVLKLAVSADGRVAARPGERTTISGPETLREVHRLRAGVQGILVGARTARVDAPLLTVRGPVTPRRPPVRIFLDARAELRPDFRALHEGDAPVWLVTGPGSPPEYRRSLEAVGARVLHLPVDGRGHFPADRLLDRLRSEGLSTLLCEGGGRLAVSLLQGDVVDRLVLAAAPHRLGLDAVPAFPGLFDPARGWDFSRPEPPEGIPGRWVPSGPPVRKGDDVWHVWDRESE